MKRWARVALALFLGACTFAPIDIEGLGPECVEGFTAVGDVCVRDSERDAGPDAGSDAGDDPPADGGMDAGPRLACPEGAFCEGFEAVFPAGLNGWGVAQGDFSMIRFPKLGIDAGLGAATDPHRGGGMMLIRTNGSNTTAELEVCPFEAGGECPSTPMPDGGVGDGGMPLDRGIRDGDIWMRSYVYIPSTVGGQDLYIDHASLFHMGNHVGFVAEGVAGFNIDNDRASMFVVNLGRFEPRPMPDAGMADAGPGDAGPLADPRTRMPRDRWVCVVTHIGIDDVEGVAESWIDVEDDGEPPELVARAMGDTLQALPYRHFGIGLGFARGIEPGVEIYYDSVAVSRSELDCVVPD